MLCTERAAQAITPGMHGTTFGGGPLVTAVAIAVIDEIKQTNLLGHIEEVGTYFITQLRDLQSRHPSIVDVRGKGLMIGCQLDSDLLAKQIASDLLTRRIIINRTSDTVLRFLPPYILERTHVDTLIAALDELLTLHTAQPHLAGEHAHG